MSRFRKRPVVIEAARWNQPGDEQEIGAPVLTMTSEGGRPYIETLEGPLFITPGDWIIKGVQGEFYPCKPEIFANGGVVIKVATLGEFPEILSNMPSAGIAPYQKDS